MTMNDKTEEQNDERDNGLSTNSTAAKSRLIPSPYKKGNPISQNCEKKHENTKAKHREF